MKRDIRIDLRTAALPHSFNGATVYDETAAGAGDEYLVMLNDTKDTKRQAAAFLHEALHIYHEDFKATRPVAEIEAERRAELRELLEILIEDEAM